MCPGSSTAEYLPFISLGDLYESSNEKFLETRDDVASDAILIPVDFPFADSLQTKVYVSFQPIYHVVLLKL